ncbi:hypothetical protein Pisl_1931 [Pyrobaculum islandicum DSM 4184]|uniref:Uncharacterized protein n=1 Tax=Pyrobaculum islandicum (strain DSM 4184 / JCM 9189 / GEO3) TaxID=384616 RepID=A1RVU6_PYRIL|nr:hypothetical protein [Pyrobaculum islandicum]ABL89078.1 hypothetical protein Pisl_1931 [Pyrobaculum islandicum DSM 4184]
MPKWEIHNEICSHILGLDKRLCNRVNELIDASTKYHDILCRPPSDPITDPINRMLVIRIGYPPWTSACELFKEDKLCGRSLWDCLRAGILHCLADRAYESLRRGWRMDLAKASPSEYVADLVDRYLADLMYYETSLGGAFRCEAYELTSVVESVVRSLLDNAEFFVNTILREAQNVGIRNVEGVKKALERCLGNSKKFVCMFFEDLMPGFRPLPLTAAANKIETMLGRGEKVCIKFIADDFFLQCDPAKTICFSNLDELLVQCIRLSVT